MSDLDFKTEKFIRDLRDGNAVAYQMVMKRADGTIEIVCHGQPENQALIMLCLEGHIKRQMFSIQDQ